jgi:transcriptional regulator with XRE-family HTH domain
VLEVKRLRQAREWNQTELAFHAGLAPSVISEIENGKRDPSARTLRKLAEALQVDVADLFPKGLSPRLPLEERGELSGYLERVNRQLDRYLSGADPKRVVAGLMLEAMRLAEQAGDEGDEARKLSEKLIPVIADADPRSRNRLTERKRAVEELLESIEETPVPETRKA